VAVSKLKTKSWFFSKGGPQQKFQILLATKCFIGEVLGTTPVKYLLTMPIILNFKPELSLSEFFN